MKKLLFAMGTMVLACGLFFGNIPTANAAGISMSKELKPYGHMEEKDGISYYKYDNPSVLQLDKRPDRQSGFKISSGSIPSQYDGRYSRNTSVKNQGTTEICWAYATMAALESNIITKGRAGKSLDLWEHQLAYFTYHGANNSGKSWYGEGDSFKSGNLAWHACGGNYLQAAATLSRGYGAIGQQNISPKANLSAAIQTKRSYGITDMVMLPDPHKTNGQTLDTTAMKQIKQSILKNGACTAQLYVDNYTVYRNYYHTIAGTANHGITVVGWDDTVPASKFGPNSPSGSGAWIVKNSWGTRAHQNGYFYVSYYSPSMAGFCSFIGDKAANINSGSYETYQYDGVGVGDSMLSSSIPVSAANTFTARKDALVSHVGTWTGEGSQKVTIKIYVGRTTATRPSSGTTVYSATKNISGAGYHRIPLGKTVGIPKGEKFSVVVTSKGRSRYFFPVEIKVSDTFSGAGRINLGKIAKGESYYYFNGKWHDIAKSPILMQDYNATVTSGNALAKAFTKRAGHKSQRLTGARRKSIRRGRTVSLKIRHPRGKGRVIYRSSNSRILKVTSKGRVKGLRKGRAKVYVVALPTATHKSVKKTITIRVR